MNKLVLLVPGAMLAVGAYLLVLAVRASEFVEVIPGHQIPPRFAALLGVILLFGGIAVGVEMFAKARKRVSSRA